ncbi:hypothetical protein [Pontibacter burrus]|uniref:Uncharacterized protein n=1 Tax=Pontibacter burrus TaxID=2704466 RepID=A0A6B3LU72_9BACT|nr:hypothetical protein [Pontibacter burrus]NEM97548.1 hypothetical protein [Pontibacter burrus]
MATPPEIYKALNPKTEIISIAATIVFQLAIVPSPFRGSSSLGQAAPACS